MKRNTNDYSTLASIITQRVSAIDVGNDLGLNPGRDGRCSCAFCSGDRKDSMRLYPGSRGFYCFRCHKGGDVIELYRQVTGLGFMETIRSINDLYGLSLPLDGSDASAMQTAREQAEKRRQERAEKEERDRRLLEAFWDVADAVQILERLKVECAPKTPSEPLKQRFVVACRYLPELTDYRDRLFDELYPMN